MSFGTEDLVALVRARGRGDPPTAMGEVFVTPTVATLQFLDAKVQLARIEQTLDTILATLEDSATLADLAARLGEDQVDVENRLHRAIDDAAANFGLTRRPAAQSYGSVVVFRSTPLTSIVTIPSGFKFYAPSLEQEYGSVNTINISSMSFDVTLNKYIASVPVQSVDVGLNTAAAIGQVVQIRDNNPQLEGVTNLDPIVGGRDQESDRDLVARIKTALSANNIGTKSGYRNLVLSLSNVKDASIIGAGDTLMVRDLSDGGSVDIYITDPVPIQVNELATIAGGNLDVTGTIFTPSRQPIINNITTVSPAPSAIIKDGTVYAGSLRAKDQITFSTSQDGVTISYFVNDNVRVVQEYLDDPDRKILGSDVLVKEVQVVLVNVIFKITVLSGFSKSVVATNVQNEVTQFISTLGVGQSLEQSDVLRIATNVAGVDRVDLPMTQFDRGGTTPQQLKVIEAAANEVLRVNTVAVNY